MVRMKNPVRKKIKLIAIDLDGSLLTSQNNITERTALAIKELLSRGVIFVIATGRMFASARKYALQFGPNTQVISYNGALIKSAAGQLLLHKPIPLNLAKDVMSFLRERKWHVNSYIDDVLYVKELNQKALIYARNSDVTPRVAGDEIYNPKKEPTKLLVVANDPSQTEQIRDEIKLNFNGRLFVAISSPLYIDLGNPETSKGRAIKFLADRLGIERDEICVIGDSENDIEMFEAAGVSIAMGNAREDVKSKASFVTASNDEDGVAVAIEEIVIPRYL